MSLSLGAQVLAAILFGLVVAGVEILISGAGWSWRAFLAAAWRLACLAYIILFGLIRV